MSSVVRSTNWSTALAPRPALRCGSIQNRFAGIAGTFSLLHRSAGVPRRVHTVIIVCCVENVVDLSVAVRYRRRLRGEVPDKASEQPWESCQPGEEVEHELMTSSRFRRGA